jgi:hypothetical protein
MDRPDKYPFLREAVQVLVDNLGEDQWLSLIVFSTKAEVIAAGLDATSLRRMETDLVAAIDCFSGRFQGTYLAPGLEQALELLDRGAHGSIPGVVQRLYVLTDGQISDPAECTRFAPYLRDLRVEVMSYGFGSDFELPALRRIMDGCYGGGVKQIADTSMVQETFRHLHTVGSRVVARDLELRFEPAAEVVAGEGFMHRPVRQYCGHRDGNAIVIPVGMLEASRTYVAGIECRLPGAGGVQQKLGTISVRYDTLDEHYEETVPLVALLGPSSAEPYTDAAEVWADLESLRSNDPNTVKAALRARIAIGRREHRDPSEIADLERTLAKLEKVSCIEDLSEDEKRTVDRNEITVAPLTAGLLKDRNGKPN